MLARHFHQMACSNAWANHRLLKACMRLSPEAFAAPRTGFFPSIAATLNHLLTVDWYYVDALERWRQGREANRDPSPFFASDVPHPDARSLHAAQRASDDRLIALCAALDDARLGEHVPVMRRAGLEPERADRLLGHLFQHQVHHRVFSAQGLEHIRRGGILSAGGLPSAIGRQQPQMHEQHIRELLGRVDVERAVM